MTNISFQDILDYLDAIAAASGLIGNSPHKVFWKLNYNDFINGTVPTQQCGGVPIPIINKADPINSSFYVILVNSLGFCNKNQMPDGGPLITDAGYTVPLPGGRTIKGADIQANIKEWLSNGFPENAKTI